MNAQCEFKCELMLMFPCLNYCICRTKEEGLMPRDICMELAVRDA